jgi:hypothetical protein
MAASISDALAQTYYGTRHAEAYTLGHAQVGVRESSH